MPKEVLNVGDGAYIFSERNVDGRDGTFLRVGISYAGMPGSDVFSLAVRELHFNRGMIASFSHNYLYPIDTKSIELFDRRFSVESVDKRTLTLIVEGPSEDWMI